MIFNKGDKVRLLNRNNNVGEVVGSIGEIMGMPNPGYYQVWFGRMTWSCVPDQLELVNSKTVFSISQVYEYQKTGRFYTIASVDSNHVSVTGEDIEAAVHYNLEVFSKNFFLKNDLHKTNSSGPHNCADHMEFCQGFRFDYHFCKVCGSKQNAS